MKGKLINRGNGNYKLYVDETTYATTSDSPYKKLSNRNCDEIFGVIDVEKLATGYDLYEKINFVGQTRAYKAGFQKAMELNKDKLFTLEDVKKVIKLSREKDDYKFDGKDCEYKFQDKEIIQSIQQPTEIEVMIEMECKIGCEHLVLNGENSLCCGNKVPKLDSNGCLILKRAK